MWTIIQSGQVMHKMYNRCGGLGNGGCAGVFFFCRRLVIAWHGAGLGGCEMRLGEQRKRGRLKIKNAKGNEPKGESILAWPSLEMTRQVEASGSSGNSVVGFSQPL